MNPLRRWLAMRSRRRLEADSALGSRLDKLIEGLRDRLPPQLHEQIAEYSEHSEWELAIDGIRAESERGLILSAPEREEISDLTSHPSVDRAMLAELGANRVRSGDIRQR